MGDLDVQRKRDILKRGLAEREAVSEVMSAKVKSMGYADGMGADGSLQQTIKDLGREMVKDALQRALRRRPSVDEAGHGVASTNKIVAIIDECVSWLNAVQF